jgi:hypothetical protein
MWESGSLFLVGLGLMAGFLFLARFIGRSSALQVIDKSSAISDIELTIEVTLDCFAPVTRRMVISLFVDTVCSPDLLLFPVQIGSRYPSWVEHSGLSALLGNNKLFLV